SCHEVTEGEHVTENFSYLPKANGCSFYFNNKIMQLKFIVPRSPSTTSWAPFLPEEGTEKLLSSLSYSMQLALRVKLDNVC
ncbi:MAG: hypothetical protein IJP32_11240, partial [Clostridia bacterium]|nr:hypothetical protein [Clostridia bacterium]